MYRSFLTFIGKNKLLNKDDKVLLAVSGGVDSMTLLHLMSKTSYFIGVAHVNYGLRGKESDLDAKLVRETCERLNIDFHEHAVESQVYDSNESIQMVARNVRYNFFDLLVKTHGYTKIATAHNANDNLETVLFNLTKGTGISGIAGIAVKTGKRIRPLLFARKEEIYKYAKRQKVKWREDQSNRKNDYHRNLIRNEVIPVLEKINPSLVETFKGTVMRFQGVTRLVEYHKDTILNHHMVRNKGFEELDLKWFTPDSVGQAMLYEILKSYGFNYRQTVDVFESITQDSVGATFFSSAFRVNLDRRKLLIEKLTEGNQIYVQFGPDRKKLTVGEIEVSLDMVEGNRPNINSDIACLDSEKVDYPLTLRNWSQGDTFQPLGMKGKKKVSDFMIDSKIPVTLKNKVLVLESGGRIAWVVGYRIDDRFKVTTSTKQMLKITLSHA